MRAFWEWTLYFSRPGDAGRYLARRPSCLMEILPRHVICILGPWRDFSSVHAAVSACGDDFTLDEEYSQLSPDERMVTAFEASMDRFNPTITDEDWDGIRSHSAVAYILSPPIPQSAAESISARALLLTAMLLNQDGLAAKSESMGLHMAGSTGSNLAASTPPRQIRMMRILRPPSYIGHGSSVPSTTHPLRHFTQSVCTCSDTATPKSTIRSIRQPRFNGLI